MIYLTVESLAVDEFLHDGGQILLRRVLNAPVNDIGGALLHAQLVHLPKELRNKFHAYFFVPVLKSLLDSIIPIRVLSQFNRVLNEFAHESLSVLVLEGLRYDYFDDAEPAVVCG
jgi:hypothetical protein